MALRQQHRYSTPPHSESSRPATRPNLPWPTAAGALAVCTLAFLLCLIPKSSSDLFWQLRAGNDILANHALPHADSYSWTSRGRPWVVPEWLSFVAFAAAYKTAHGFAGPWLILVVANMATAVVIWRSVMRQMQKGSLTIALALTYLSLFALGPFIQVRPYLFTNLFLAIAIDAMVDRGDGKAAALRGITPVRGGPAARMAWLVPLCMVWTNLHQGVMVCVAILFVIGAGDWAERSYRGFARHYPGPGRTRGESHAARPRAFALAALACGAASLISPYGWQVYKNVLTTMGDPTAMAVVGEWHPTASIAPARIWGYWLLLIVVALGYIGTRRPRVLGELLAVSLLAVESLLHLRNIGLFAVGGTLFAAPHIQSALERVCRWANVRVGIDERGVRAIGMVVIGLLLLSTELVARDVVVPYTPPQPLSPPGNAEQNGRHVPWAVLDRMARASLAADAEPYGACRFIEREKFPANLRIFNSYDIGGFLIWRLPQEPVFVDGRDDVYLGRCLDDYTTFHDGANAVQCAQILRRYDFDCVITDLPEDARPFWTNADWQIVYWENAGDVRPGFPRTAILLRKRPRFRALIAHCLRDSYAMHGISPSLLDHDR